MATNNTIIKVLYVDDEVNNLNSFKATFRKEYSVQIAQSANDALQLINKETFHVIISDLRMPGKSGTEFFEQLVEQHPEPIRILLTGYADIQSVIDAINKGEVYRFIDKPWDYQSVRVAIKNAFEIYETRKLLKKYNEELLKAYDELDKFVYSVSHDLRAPLTSVLGLVKLARSPENIKNNSVDPDDLNYMELIEKSVDKLDIFIRNIIDYYRSTRMESFNEEINFHDLLQNSKHELEFFPNFHNLNIILKINNPENIPFKSDQSRLRIIFNNIVSNSIKYQKIEADDSILFITIDINATNATMVFYDNGIGINEKHLSEIFKMFFRANNINAGSGIGLYIVNEAVKKLEGTIEAQSIKGEKTVFTVILPNRNLPK